MPQLQDSRALAGNLRVLCGEIVVEEGFYFEPARAPAPKHRIRAQRTHPARR